MNNLKYLAVINIIKKIFKNMNAKILLLISILLMLEIVKDTNCIKVGENNKLR